MAASFWIDSDAGGDLNVQDCGFLVSLFNTSTGVETYRLLSSPARTNVSNEARGWGWCGETNNVSVTAWGLARIEQVARTGRRRVRPITGDDRRVELEALGYPDLRCARGE